ncbi:holo-[acyl-carrier-protein] synthase [Enterococcus sp. 8G7_MSG3316]|uniref:Holo-[acyl-carrier-protein] synthase n=1 Tax=Candidatus Enterococcus testudinis TaxID=1834191 RepID=A0A242AAM5_9ENTE|nr:holo-ACP synthase [Enterococcus sp. 8G7_MSG3316]OTN77663.1 holo-[acyl-carrier-protein] synthase [Enterococcus sp. 8G7_MSG3316]
MIKGIGIDAVELPRIKALIEQKPRFVARILTEAEMALFSNLPLKRQVEFLAGRYACKEAFSKAWGTGIGQVSFHDLEILSNEAGAPVVTKAPYPLDLIFVSITHTNDTAFAQMILEMPPVA